MAACSRGWEGPPCRWATTTPCTLLPAADGDALLAQSWQVERQPRPPPRARQLPASGAGAGLAVPQPMQAAAWAAHQPASAPAAVKGGLVLRVADGRIVRPRSTAGSAAAVQGQEGKGAPGVEPGMQQDAAEQSGAPVDTAMQALAKRDVLPAYVHIRQNVWVSKARPRYAHRALPAACCPQCLSRSAHAAEAA